jgi:hypothetical protein
LPGYPTHFFRDLQKILSCSFVGSIAKSHQVTYTTPNKRTRPINRVNFVHCLQDRLVLSFSVLSLRYNCCTDGSRSPGNYEYPLVYNNMPDFFFKLFH